MTDQTKPCTAGIKLNKEIPIENYKKGGGESTKWASGVREKTKKKIAPAKSMFLLRGKNDHHREK